MDYKVYQITKKEMFRYAAVYILADVLISLLFYRSVLAAVVFLPGICFFFREVRRELAKKRRKQLERGFLVGMRCVSTALIQLAPTFQVEHRQNLVCGSAKP